MKVTLSLQLLQALRKSGAIPPLNHTSVWRGYQSSSRDNSNITFTVKDYLNFTYIFQVFWKILIKLDIRCFKRLNEFRHVTDFNKTLIHCPLYKVYRVKISSAGEL